MAFQDGLSSFLTTWSGVNTAHSFNQTGANSGTDTQAANSSTYGTATGYPNYGLAAKCDAGGNSAFDTLITTDVAMLLYLPASGYTADTTYGLFHNGGGTNAQSGWARYITGTGWQLCINHNSSGTTREEAYYTLGEVSGWYCVGFQFEDNSGNIALWVDGVNVAETTRSTALAYGSGDPDIGGSQGREPTAWAGTDTVINGTGILIANFVADNANDTNTSPPGNGDSFYTDFYDAHAVSSGDELTANDIVSASVVGTTTLAQRVLSPVVHATFSTNSASDALTADDIASASSVGSPALTMPGLSPVVHATFSTSANADELTANGAVAATSASSPAVGQVHALGPLSLAASAVVAAVTLGQAHGIGASGAISASSVATAAIGQTHLLAAVGLTSPSTAASASIGQAHVLAAADMAAVPDLGSPGVGTSHPLGADGVVAAPDVGSPAAAGDLAVAAIGVQAAFGAGIATADIVVPFGELSAVVHALFSTDAPESVTPPGASATFLAGSADWILNATLSDVVHATFFTWAAADDVSVTVDGVSAQFTAENLEASSSILEQIDSASAVFSVGEVTTAGLGLMTPLGAAAAFSAGEVEGRQNAQRVPVGSQAAFSAGLVGWTAAGLVEAVPGGVEATFGAGSIGYELNSAPRPVGRSMFAAAGNIGFGLTQNLIPPGAAAVFGAGVATAANDVEPPAPRLGNYVAFDIRSCRVELDFSVSRGVQLEVRD